jgi:hypothetical protein
LLEDQQSSGSGLECGESLRPSAAEMADTGLALSEDPLVVASAVDAMDRERS